MLKFHWVNSIFILLVILLFIFKVPVYIFILLIFGWLILTIIGSFHMRWNYHVNALNFNAQVKQNAIAITFDDGPHPEYTPQILAILQQYNAKATFFCIGKEIEKHPELFKKMVEDGHVVGNHSFSHSNHFGFFTSSKVIDELNQTKKLINKIIRKNCTLFRPPFGVTNPAIKKAIRQTNSHVIGWNKRSLDTKIKDPEKIYHRITKGLKAGDVILLHDTNERAVSVLEQLLLFLQKNQLETITIDKLFEIEAYD